MRKSFVPVVISIIISLFLGIFIYSKINYSQVKREYVERFVDKRLVTVNNSNNSIVIKPKERDAMVGYIFYPENNIDENAYIPLMAKVAERGFNVYIVKTPLHLNLNGNKLGKDIISINKDINSWIISGINEGERSAKEFYDKIKEDGKFELFICKDIKGRSTLNKDYCNYDISKDSKILIKSLNELLY
ncbi:alpha/beta hydrolase [Eubacterium multiforme]|uniref:Alpha/beta hydrolase fold-5 domain-containing protein n=1 Tax=Eubacterium multiforme TaxID=83339 RepID=A0ABT9UVF9_9FIRM|nr:alpha/beta hydrolase [Eubacterium multiforme]MDQ0150295.1 hypothetical protein [Eubacterium multiforme]